MNEVTQIINQITTAFDALLDQPGGIRNSATYQFIIQLKQRLIEGGIPFKTAEIVVAEMPVEMSPDFHTRYPDEFEQMLTVFTTAILQCSSVINEDFENGDAMLGRFAKSFSVTIQY